MRNYCFHAHKREQLAHVPPDCRYGSLRERQGTEDRKGKARLRVPFTQRVEPVL